MKIILDQADIEAAPQDVKNWLASTICLGGAAVATVATEKAEKPKAMKKKKKKVVEHNPVQKVHFSNFIIQ